MNLIKLSAQPQLSTNYLPFYSPTPKPTSVNSLLIASKPSINQEIFKQGNSILSPKHFTGAVQHPQIPLRKDYEIGLLSKVLNNGQGLLTQRDHQSKPPEIKINGSLSERSLFEKKQWGIKKVNILESKREDEEDSSVMIDKENHNTMNQAIKVAKPFLEKSHKMEQFIEKPTEKSSKMEKLAEKSNILDLPEKSNKWERFFLPNGNPKDSRRKDLSYNINSRQEEPQEQEKFNLLDQRLEISRNLVHQTQNSQDYNEFMRELKSHRTEIVDLRKETIGLRQKVEFLETQLVESDRRKKLDELNDLLSKANLENKIIRKKTKNRDLKKNNNTEDLGKIKENKENALKTQMKSKLEFKKLLQKTDISKLVMGVGGNSKDNHNKSGKKYESKPSEKKFLETQENTLNSERSSKNNVEMKKILNRRMSNELTISKEKPQSGKEKDEKGNISESLNNLKNRLANFLNNYNNKNKKK